MFFALFLVMPVALIHGFNFIPFATFAPWIDGTNVNVQFAVKAINEFYAKQGDNTQRTLVAVLQSQSQGSIEVNYQFTLRVSTGDQSEICYVDVLSRSGTPIEVTKDPVCNSETLGKRVGGETPIDINDPDVKKALDFAVARMNAMENYMYLRTATKVAKVTSQIVAGISYHFSGVEMSTTNCDKMSTHQLSSCAVADGASKVTCEFKVWWQSWSTPEYQLNDLHCS
ncbi:uncharacterized protein LOC106060232 [Biomphalaria glabrata]|uniref:Cystatin n=1 Tax=Biomphalaria glabrata TaxID=6526 RepID=A0A2C9LNU4_BIOGL|nr:uncharacterized protein LOC106060232 [Biomphalaria glabrata]